MSSLKIIGGEHIIDPDALNKRINRFEMPQLSLGRTCLYAILTSLQKDISCILLPDYLCYSVAEVPLRINMPITHYHISSDFLPDFEDIRKKANENTGKLGILLISYFGMVDLNRSIQSIRQEYPDMIIIVDDVQNYFGFGKHIDFDYCFTSYRKWFEVPDGADILQKNDDLKLECCYHGDPEYASYKVAGNLLKNNTEMIGDSISLEMLEKGEKMMDESYLYSCSEIGRSLYQRIDTRLAAEKRKSNAEHLHKGLQRLNIEHLFDPSRIPLFIPIIHKNRDQIRKVLFADNVFPPVHWPVMNVAAQGNNELYNVELSLICDQRYDVEDMDRILRGIENAL